MDLTLGKVLVALSQGLQFLVPIVALYLSKKEWFNSKLTMNLFLVSMISSVPLITFYYPNITYGSEPRIVILYAIFAVGFALFTDNLPLTILLTCFSSEVHEIIPFLLLRSNINFMGKLGNTFHSLIMILWMFLVFYSAMKIRNVIIDNSFMTVFVSAFVLNGLIYFINPQVDIPPLTYLAFLKRLIWFTALIIMFRRT